MPSYDCCVVIICNPKILVTIDNPNNVLLLIKYIVQKRLLAPGLGGGVKKPQEAF